jgi:drug/metabolite transporter (DMT)-like permease
LPNQSVSKFGFTQTQILLTGTAATALWSLSTVLTKGLLNHIPPLTQLVVQLCGVNIFLWTVVRWLRLPLPRRSQLRSVGLPGLLQPGISSILFIVGLSLTSVGNETLISVTETVLTILLGWLILGEKMERRSLLLVGVALIGVVLITINSNSDYGTVVGNLLTLISAVCYALYAIVCRRLVVNFHPLVLMAVHQSVGSVLVGGIWLLSLPWLGITVGRAIAPHLWALAALSGITLFAIPFWLYIVLLKHTQAGVASLFLTLIPVFGIAGGYVFLGERLTLMQGIGGGLILTAVLGVSLLHRE